MTHDLSLDDRTTLLDLAARTLRKTVYGETLSLETTDSDVLNQLRGAFVTLYRNGRLRGCIGRILGSEPLYKVIQEMTIQSGAFDSRFSPVGVSELEKIRIEISVLSPLEKVPGLDKIQVGVHGLYLQHDGRAGVFLPQVPVDNGWDVAEYLVHLCQKAGLKDDAYRHGDLFWFSAQVFGDSHEHA